MIHVNLQLFGGRGGGSGGGAGGGGSSSRGRGGGGNSHQTIMNAFNTLQSVDLGWQANEEVQTWRNLYEKIRSGEPFHPTPEEGRIVNGWMINQGIEGMNIVSYNQTYDLNTVSIQNVKKASQYFRDYIRDKSRLISGEWNYLDYAKQELENQRRTQSTRRRRK